MLFVTSCNQKASASVSKRIESISKGEVQVVKPKAKAKTFAEIIAKSDSKAFAAIKNKATTDHPNDYITQAYVIEAQCKSYVTAGNFPWTVKADDNTNKIFDKAYDDFGLTHDYITMLFVLERQLKAYLKIK